MTFTNPKQSTAKTTALMFVGLTIGAMASRATFGIIHEDKAGLNDADAKKQGYMKLAKRAGMVAASGYAAAGLQGKDDASIIMKNIALGAGGIQVIDGVKDAASGNAKLMALTTGTKTQKATAKALGLGCPCETTLMAMPLNAPRRRRRLNGPSLLDNNGVGNWSPPIISQNNPFQSAMNRSAGM